MRERVSVCVLLLSMHMSCMCMEMDRMESTMRERVGDVCYC